MTSSSSAGFHHQEGGEDDWVYLVRWTVPLRMDLLLLSVCSRHILTEAVMWSSWWWQSCLGLNTVECLKRSIHINSINESNHAKWLLMNDRALCNYELNLNDASIPPPSSCRTFLLLVILLHPQQHLCLTLQNKPGLCFSASPDVDVFIKSLCSHY